MAQKITFTFPSSTITSSNLRDFKLFSNSVIDFGRVINFRATVLNGNDPYVYTPPFSDSLENTEIVKGISINNFANNFYLWLSRELSVADFYNELTIVGNVVELIWGSDSDVNTFSLKEPTTGVVHSDAWLTITEEVYTIPAPIVPVVLDEKIILSRSPFNFRLTPGITFDEITAEIYIYRGHKIDDKPAISNYQVSKSVVQVGQTAINFDIHKLVNDFVKNKYNGIGNIAGAFTTSTLDSVWCYIDAKINLGGAEQYQANQYLLAVDGFGYHTELANPEISILPDIIYRREKVLTSIDNHIIYNDSDYPLYFITTGLVSLTVNGTNVPFTFDQDIANQNIAYVNIANYIDSSTSFSAVFFYDATEVPSVTINFTIKDECKYPLINCIFKNKFGFWQTIPFNKLSKKNQDFTNESYNGMISNYGNYALNSHVKQTYNINGREKVTVNTDFISEEYNLLFTELMLSEFVYLEENGQVLPVNIVKTSFEKKTKLINKLIQYSMDFEYSFDILNNIL
jgi:hypothetical protein